MVRSAALLAVSSLLCAPAAAGAMIQIDRGIAGARLGNSKAEVRAALGVPGRVIKGTTIFGPYTEYRHRGGIRVLFQGNRGVTSVDTTGQGDRTRRGVGVGSTEQEVEDRVARARCRTFDGTRICRTARGLPGQRMTSFFIEGGTVRRVSVGIVID